MIDELVNMKDGDYSEEDNIFYTQVKQVSITSKERDVTVAIDGEPIGILPATFEIIPNALRVRMLKYYCMALISCSKLGDTRAEWL
jgi:diacylglycerol kinase (ATP)